jgi:hypothetical protein
MSETNGEGKSRLDRIEEMIERSERRNAQQVLANEAAHERFEAEDKRLLTAQILMNDAMTKVAGALAQAVATMDKLEMKLLETGERLDALIKVVDGVIRRDPPPYRT